MLAATKEFVKKPICIITYNEIQARKIVEDLNYFTDKVIYLPKKEIVTYDYIAESKDLPYERIEALNKIQELKTGIVVTTVEAAIQKMISKNELYKNTLNFKIGEEHKLEDIKQKLVDLGYVRYDLIDGRGQFSVRGGIVDISITEKTRQYGMLSSIGATRKQIKKNVYYEALILGIIGIPLGILLGLIATFILVIVSDHFLATAFGEYFKLTFTISFIAILFLFFIQTFASKLGGFIAGLFDYTAIDKDGTFMYITIHHIVQMLVALLVIFVINLVMQLWMQSLAI